MTDYDSPVKRLYEILEKALAIQSTAAVRYIWADVLGIDREDSVQLYFGIADLIRLADLAQKQVEEADVPNRDKYLCRFPR